MTIGFMLRRRRAILPTLLMIAVAGCSRSPEVQSARFMDAGKQLMQKGDAARALLEFKNAAQATPRNPDVYYQLGRAYVASGDWGKGVANLKRVLELNPKHEQARLMIAQLMSYSDQPSILKEAQDRLQALLEDTPESPDALHTLALTELKLGDVNDAIQLLDRAMKGAPQELIIAVTLAQAKLQQQDAKGAEVVLKKACENLPKSANPVIVLGRFYLSQKRAAEAEAEIRRALTIDPNSADALFTLATLQDQTGHKQEAERTFARLSGLPGKAYKPTHAMYLFQVGMRGEAIREFEKLAKEDPSDRMARTRLVTAYGAVGRQEDAGRVLAEVLKKNPKDMDALVQEAELLLATGKYGDAERDLNKVLPFQPNSAELHYVKAQLHRARGQASTYRQELSEVLRLDPYLLAARLELARVSQGANDARSAVRILDEAPPSQRDLLAVLTERNWALWLSGDLREMRKGIDKGLSRVQSIDLLLQDGLWKLRSGNPSGARASLEGALKKNPADLRALGALRTSYALEKRESTALQKVVEYAALQPKSAPVQDYLGFVLLAAGDRERAKAAFTAAKAADPQYIAADLALAQLDYADHRPGDAIARVKAILATDTGNVAARLWLGRLEVWQGNRQAALGDFQKVVDQDPNNAEALNSLAYLMGESGERTTEALKYAQKAQELMPEDPEYADTVGWILYRKALYPAALMQLQRAASHEGNPVWKYHLAMAYVKVGDLRRGRTALDAALKMNPNLPEAKIAKEMVGGK